jgi:4-oxalocrotonate tautomerase
MSGDAPDACNSARADDGCYPNPDEEDSVTLIQVKLLEGVFTAPQKQEIIERLSDAMVEIEGENTRLTVWCLIEEVANGEWGIGGQTFISDDVKALARARPAPADDR